MGTYLITGAGSGIGRLVARALHDRGEALVLLARSRERAGDLAGDFRGADVLVADLADPDALADLRLPEAIAGVVHSAGVVDVGAVADTDPDSLRLTVDVDLLAPMLLTHRVLEAVRRARGTHVFVNSGSGLAAKAGWASYNAAKFGLRGFADGLRQEEAGHGVRVTSVYPGRTATPMQEAVHAAEGAAYDPGEWIRPETVAGEVVRVLDLGRDATVKDLVLSPTSS